MAVLFHYLPLVSLLLNPRANAFQLHLRNDVISLSTNTHTVYQYPLGTWVENIAVRQNGNLLITFTQPSAELHEINPYHPLSTNDSTASLIHHFGNSSMCTGIAEFHPDVFAVISDNTVYRVDFQANNNSTPSIRPITTIPAAGTLNGMAHLPHTSTLFVSDSERGLIWRVDARTGNYTVHSQDASMAPTTELGLALGINGLRYLEGYVYYVNSPRRLFCRVAVDERTGAVAGEFEIVAEGALSDDFNVRLEGGRPVGYLAGLNDNVVTRVTMDGAKEVVAGGLNSTVVAGATSGAFGRTAGDEDVLYVTTGGASAAPVNGTYVEGGKIVSLGLTE